MKHTRWVRTIPLAAAITLGLGIMACGQQDSAPSGAPAASAAHAEGEAETEHDDQTPVIVELSPEAMERAGIRVEEVLGGHGEYVMLAPAELQPNADRVARVGPRVAGRIHRVIGTLGARVRAGQPLATIWSPEAAEAAAALDSARAAERLARQALARERDLFERRVAAQREVLEAEAALANAEAAVQAAEARLAAMGFPPPEPGVDEPRNPLVTVTSPIGGTIIERDAAMDAPVGPGSVLFTIADLSTLWLTVRVPETQAAAVTTGQTVSVNVGASPNRPVDGRVDYVAPIVAPETRTVDVRLEVPNRGGELRPGMSATARFDLSAGEVAVGADPRVLVPRSAVQELEQATVVFVPAGERQFRARPVSIGSTYGSDVEVLSGLRIGERVVVQGAFTLKAESLRGAVADPH